MRAKSKETTREKLPLNRLEVSVAEILRQNAPLGYSDLDGMLWLDLVSDFSEMLGTEKPRFDTDAFYTHCFDGEAKVNPTGRDYGI